MKQIFQVLLLSSFFVFSGCFGSNEEEEPVKNLENTGEYTIKIPQDWEIFPKEEYPKSIILSARQPSYSSRIPAMIAIAKESSRPQNLDQFIKRNLEEVRRNSQDFQKISEKKIENENVESQLIEYREKRSNDNSLIGIYSYYLLPKNQENSYLVTMVFDPEISDDDKKKLETIITSFNFKKSEKIGETEE